jgi:uncharacterized membrane protein
MTGEATEGQLESIERRLRDLTRRLERMERGRSPSAYKPPSPGAQPPSRPASFAAPTAAPARPEPPSPSPRFPQRGLEELLGGRVLAWVGGGAIFLGIVFLLGIAIDRGWIDESMRTMLGFFGSTSLLLTGVWLHERKGRTDAALAAVASALAGLYATLLVGAQIYDLIPVGVGLAGAGLVGIVGVAIAVRWKATVVAAIGILGALLAPVLVGAGTTWPSLAFMAIALTAAVGVLLWKRWNWLSLGAFLVSTPQLLAWVSANYNEQLLPTLGVLVAFWALYVIAAIGFELRTQTADELPVFSWLLLLANVVLIAGAGYFVLYSGHPDAAVAWLLGLAASHILLGALALRQAINREIGSLLITVGLGLSAFGFADALEGPVLVVGWAVEAAVFIYLATRASTETRSFGSNAERLLIAAGAFLGLALGHVLAFEAPPIAIVEGVTSLGDAFIGLGACAAVALYGKFALRDFDSSISQALEAVGAGALFYLASVAIVDTFGITDSGDARQMGQVLLSVFWALTGLGAVVYGLLRDVRRFRLSGLALLALAAAKVATYDLAELDELSRVLSFVALGMFLLVGAFAYQRIRVSVGDDEVEATR